MFRSTQHIHADETNITAEADADGPVLLIKFMPRDNSWPVSPNDLFIYTKSLDDILDLGYAIVNSVNEIKKSQRRAEGDEVMAASIDFGESLEANIGTLNEHAERISETQLGHLVDEARRTRLEREAEQAI